MKNHCTYQGLCILRSSWLDSSLLSYCAIHGFYILRSSWLDSSPLSYCAIHTFYILRSSWLDSSPLFYCAIRTFYILRSSWLDSSLLFYCAIHGFSNPRSTDQNLSLKIYCANFKTQFLHSKSSNHTKNPLIYSPNRTKCASHTLAVLVCFPSKHTLPRRALLRSNIHLLSECAPIAERFLLYKK